jgi:serine-type D-Ala-D-Ala carboxypeptidase (penicillin-binding protein 5/6)
MPLLTAMIATASLAAADKPARPRYDSAAPIAYMVDMATGTVLVDKASRRKIQPASMAKMMTVYVAFDLIASGRLDPDMTFTVRPDVWQAWNKKGSSMFLKTNERVRVADLLQGVISVSGNDAAIVLAEGIAGSEAAFVQRMNATAQKLGMKDSKFATANGWPDQGRTLTTAYDLAVLGRRTIHDFPALYRQFYGKPRFTWNGISQPNRNPVLGRIAGADGIKTGFTSDAGYCFTGTAEQNGRRLMMVLAGLPSADARAAESRRMLLWGFAAWRAQPLFKRSQTVASLPVQIGTDRRIDAVAPRNLALALPANAALRYRLFVRYDGPIRAPITKGVQVAQLVAKFDDGSERTMPLVAARSVDRAGYFRRAFNGLASLVGA